MENNKIKVEKEHRKIENGPAQRRATDAQNQLYAASCEK